MVKLFGFLDNSTHNNNTHLLTSMFNSFEFGKADYIETDNFGVGHIKIPSMNRKGIAEDKNAIVCFTGEIFEFGEGSAEEYILKSYNTLGTKFIEKLNGTFVFTIYDKNQNKLLIVNDRYGMKPVYYYSDKNKIIFSSEIKAIITDNKIKHEINWDFWKDYFAYGYALGNKTPFNKIYSLPNASILEFKNGITKTKQYWDYDNIKINYERTEEETINQGVKIIKNVIQRQTKGLKECTVLLSGGYDSRCIAAAIKKYTNVKINAYTIPKNYFGADTFKDDDVKYAKLIAKKLKIKHKIVPANKQYYERYLKKFIKQQEASGYENMWMMPIIDHLDSRFSNFDGLAGDVFLKAGYLSKPSFSYSMDITNNKILKKSTDKELANILDYYLKNRSVIHTEDISPYFVKDIKKHIISSDKSIYDEIKKIKRCDNRIKVFQAKNRTKNVIALQPNSLIMRKIYSKTPFLDNEFVEFGLSIPQDMKIRVDIYKKILEKSFPEVMIIPTTNQTIGFKKKFKKFLLSHRLNFLRYSIGKIWGIIKMFKVEKKHIGRLSDNPKDVMYLVNLAKKMEMPDFIDKKLLLKDINSHLKDDKDPTYFLEPIMHFSLWFNNFYIGKEKLDNTIRRIK